MANKVVNASIVTLVLLMLAPLKAWALPPNAVDDAFVGVQDTQVSENVLANGDSGTFAVTVSDATAPATGTFAWAANGDITYDPVPYFSGTVGFSYEIFEADPTCVVPIPAACYDTALGTIFIAPVADLPTLSLGSPSGPEETAIPLAMTITLLDTDGSETVDIVLSGLPAGASISPGIDLGGGAYQLTPAQVPAAMLTPPTDFVGTINVSVDVTVTDNALDPTATNVQDIDTDSDSFDVTVTDVNDDPFQIAPEPVLVTDEDVNISQSLAGIVDDVDLPNGDVLTYVVTGSTNPAVDLGSTSMSGDTLDIVLLADQNGAGDVIVEVTDNAATTPVTLNVPLTVNSVNDDPFPDVPVTPVVTPEDVFTSTDLAGTVDDVDIVTDGDFLTFTLQSISHPAVDPAFTNVLGTTLNIGLFADTSGTGSITVRVSDNFGGVPVDVVVPLTVTAVNDDPQLIAPIPSINMFEDTTEALDIATLVDDADIPTGDFLTYSILGTTNPSVDLGASNMAGSVLNVLLLPDQFGIGDIVVQVEDNFGGVPLVLNIPVIVSLVNDDPVQTGPVPVIVTDEDVFPPPEDLNLIVDDVDIVTNGDNLNFTITNITNPAIDAAQTNAMGGLLSIELLPDMFGTGDITVEVSDIFGGAPFDLVIPVTVNEENDGPITVGTPVPPSVTVDEDSPPVTVDFTGVFDDVDIPTGDSLTLTVSLDSGANVFDSMGFTGETLNLAFTADANGSAMLLIEATDTDGAVEQYLYPVTVNPINDAPFVSGGLINRNMNEDDPPELVPLDGVFDDVDILTNGDTLSYEVSTDNPALFTSVAVVPAMVGPGFDIVLTLAPDANGTADVTVNARDAAGEPSPPVVFTLDVTGVDDMPIAVDDSVAAIYEDDAELRVDVLANDYLADVPSIVLSVGDPGLFYLVDANGDTIASPTGVVTIDGSEIVFQPTPDFWGPVSIEYWLQDSDGDIDTAFVTFDVTAVNDVPEAQPNRYFSVFEGSQLDVDLASGLLQGAYDLDGSVVDALGNPIYVEPLSVVFQTAPPATEGTLVTTSSDGTFSFVPAVGFFGTTSFEYTVFDGTAQSAVSTVYIEVLALPSPGAAPNAGEVSVLFNLSNTPLEQSASVPPNVLVTMDDSGSMDWHITVDSTDDNGRFVIDNSTIATSNVRSRLYTYLFALNVNTYGWNSGNGRVLPSQESLPAGNDYNVWQARSAAFNGIYYNPEVTYEPWTGLDNANVDFADAVPTAIRLDPRSTSNTLNITNDQNYTSHSVPNWATGGGSADINVTNFYIPRYYTATGTRVEIRPANEPFAGGSERIDCAVPTSCTYAEEIQNFANWFQYYRSREHVAKAAVGAVVAELQDIRVGFETINRRNYEQIAEMNEYYWEGEKAELLETIYETNSSSGTPLRRALDDAGEILGCNHSSRDCPSLPAPEGICQQNFSLLFSDGYWNGSAPFTGNFDQDGPGPFDGGKYADSESDTLADIAMFYYENDLFPGTDDGVPLSTADIDGVPTGTFTSTNELIHQHMKTFTIAFGVEPDIDAETAESADATVSFPWPAPGSTPNSKIDDMLHAAINGRGRFLNAGDPQDLQTAVGTAFLEFTQAASSTSAAAFNSTSLRDGTLLYRAFYDLRNRTGELTATSVDTAGVVATTPTWQAAELLDAAHPSGLSAADRKIVTWNPNTNAGIQFVAGSLTPDQALTLSNNQVNYMRGDRSLEEPSGSLRPRLTVEGMLGDIVNSSPVFVGEPRAFNRDQAPYPTSDLYSDFANAQYSRQPMVYVGANDGMLHGFNAETGLEVMAYVPNMIIDSSKSYSNKLNNFTSSFYLHDYYVDLTPRLNDVYMRPNESSSKQWMTTLVGGLGAGGKGYFALNVNDPASLFADQAATANAVLWEFTDADDTYPLDVNGDPLGGAVGARVDFEGNPVKDLGYALSLPTISMSNKVDTDGNQEWVAIFGNGTNSTSGVATLFMLYMDKGMDGWAPGDFKKIPTEWGVPLPGEPLEGYPNALGSPTAVDIDLNGTTDYVYAGDRLGNLFRFDVTDPNPDNWFAVRLFTATYEVSPGVEELQPALSKPTVTKHPDQPGFLITFGTGSFVAEEDGSDTSVQSIYTIWDPLTTNNPPTAQTGSKSLRLVEQVITNVVDDSVTPAQTRRILTSNPVNYTPETGSPGVYGWYIDLDMERAQNTLSGATNTDISGNAPPDPQFPGEKAIRRFVFRDGVLLTTTVLPATDATSCLGVRPGAILVLDQLTGGDPDEAVIDFNLDGYVDENDLLTVGGDDFSAGLLFDHTDLDGALVDLSTLGGEGDTDFLFVSGGNDTISYRIRDLTEEKTGRLSWSEIQED